MSLIDRNSAQTTPIYLLAPQHSSFSIQSHRMPLDNRAYEILCLLPQLQFESHGCPLRSLNFHSFDQSFFWLSARKDTERRHVLILLHSRPLTLIAIQLLKYISNSRSDCCPTPQTENLFGEGIFLADIWQAGVLWSEAYERYVS